ncbi:MAG: site-2 protease family protein [Sciscionella sp.]|nr:site-2 protease family protein [Sciscionella sp.]
MRPSPVFLGILAAAVLGGVLCAFGPTDLSATQSAMVKGGTVLLVLGGWGVSLCLHEFGHAFVAYRGGDVAVRAKGYLTLDPRRYTDPVFSLLIPLLLVLVGGIPLPGGAVWINHHALRDKKVESAVSLAGPLSNLAIGVLLTLVVKLALPADAYVDGRPALHPLGWALSFLALLQIFAFLLNILPIPGLDGWGALEPWLPYEAQRFGAQARPWAPLILFAVLIGIHPIGDFFQAIASDIFTGVGGNAFSAGNGQVLFFFWRS